MLKQLQSYIGKLYYVTIKAKDSEKWGYDSENPIPIRFVEWNDDFMELLIESYEGYLEEAGVVEDGEWKKKNIICIAMFGSEEKKLNKCFQESGGFLFVDTKKMKESLGPLLITNTDDWDFVKVAKSIDDLILTME